SLHCERPDPQVDFAAGPLFVNTRLTPWQTAGGPRRAGVSAFGLSGTNAHVVLEEPPAPAGTAATSRPASLLLLSARSESALTSAAGNLARWLAAHPETALEDTAYTLQVGRRRFRHRLALVSRGAEDAAAALGELAHERIVTTAIAT